MSAAEVTQTSIDEELRSIYLFGPIDAATVQLVVPAVYRFALADLNETIHVHLMTNGGEFSCGLAIYDVLRSIPTAVTTYAHGDVLSTGVVIFLAGRVRVVYPNTSLMLHRPYTSLSDASLRAVDDLELYLAAQEARLERVLAEAGCPQAFGPIGQLTGDVWVHGPGDLIEAGLGTVRGGVPGYPPVTRVSGESVTG